MNYKDMVLAHSKKINSSSKFMKYLICFLTLFLGVFLLIEYPILIMVIFCCVILIVLLFKVGIWRTMVLFTLIITTMRSSNFSDSLGNNTWYLLQFTPLLVIIVKLIFEPIQKLRKVDMLVIAYILVFNFVALFTSVIGVYPENSLFQSILLLFISIFLLLSYIKRWTKQFPIQGDLYIIYIYIILVGLMGLVLYLLNPTIVIADYGRFKGLYSNANYVGMISAIGIMLGIYLSCNKKRGEVYLNLLGGIILVLNLILSGSRGSILALIIGLFSLLFYKEFRQRLYKQLIIIIPTGLLFGVYLLITNLDTVLGSFGRDAQNSDITSGRLDIYNILIQHWLESPVFGVGYRNAETLEGVIGISPHNIYLSVLTEMGLIGLIVFLMLLITILFAVKIQGKDKILVGTVVTILAIELTESSIFGFGGPTALISWVLILIYASIRNKSTQII